ncbi:carboxypeptidase regulatory-like domain-containing protein, partial [Streptomyces sp. NPDC057062]|uniref:carboxypeptidase regulatory-like domain-containing protein n=1 Tax=Streptomyces sp. NPDC057062 TaxID=3346011 RepID=UPI003639F6DD
LTGTVAGTTAPGTARPVAGAPVHCAAPTGGLPVATGLDGTYSVWLPAKGGPVGVIVSADGYRPATRSVRLVKEGAVTADFRLQER